MKFAIWTVAALVLLLWSGAVWTVAWLLEWSIGLTASGEGVDPASVLSKIDLPAWVTWWIDPAWLSAALEALALAAEKLQAALPWLSIAVGWLVVLLWMVWGIGAIASVLIAWAASRAVGRASKRMASPA